MNDWPVWHWHTWVTPKFLRGVRFCRYRCGAVMRVMQ